MRKIVPLVLAAFGALFSATSSSAQLALNCAGLDPAKDGDADKAFLCLEDYQQRLEALEAGIAKLIDRNTNQPFVLAGHSHVLPEMPAGIPTGAVLAFDLPGGCPDGWARFAEAQGRTLIGASFGMDDPLLRNSVLTGRKYRDHGGQEEVVLTEAQMPRHDHGGITGDDNTSVILYNRNEGFGLVKDTDSRIDVATNNRHRHKHPIGFDGGMQNGATAPHNNMPPFVALYYCRKN